MRDEKRRLMKYILIALFIYIAYRVIKNIRSMSVFTQRTVQNTIEEPKELIACAKCGTFVLKANALSSNGNYYCSQSCADH
jgi:formylmethanofuran dehydrogenase subunit E